MEKFINNAPFVLVLVFLVIGFVLLIKGADFFVEGSSSVAKALYLATDKKAKVYASRESISYRTETRGRRIVYRPRYSSDYIKEYNRKHKKKISVFTNPIKRICG